MASTPSSELPSWWRVVATLAVGTVIALVLAQAVTTMGEGSDPRPVADPGQVYDYPFAEDELPHAGEVSLPWARIEVAVGTPQRELPTILNGAADVAPPEGGSFVRVDARPADNAQLPFAATGRPLQVAVEIVLRADGAEYSLSGPGGLRFDPNDFFVGATGSRWVAVPGHPSELEVAVLVDGKEQTVHADGTVSAGRAAGLAELPGLRSGSRADEVACGPTRRVDDSSLRLPDGLDDLACTVRTTFRTPYVDGVGWAPEGHEYLVVVAAHDDVPSVDGPAGERWNATDTLTGRLDGAEPVVDPVDVNAVNAGTLAIQLVDGPRMLVFEVPETGSTGDLVLRLDIDARPDDPADPGHEQMRLESTVPEEDLR
ncbi:hypothetical protein ASG73_02240 [Janibacter sp. Soil728]|uniref:hypothetical protein n=1 Tax=Janibacter sp. Soil728 TaxID=1736393 RepID=UPI0006FF9B20|nr:hypothetical protein [Janibacter sp. Soil728]KRE39184.1 hypothetical protein ASG73_02240 [Janibacter sp. Soil728]